MGLQPGIESQMSPSSLTLLWPGYFITGLGAGEVAQWLRALDLARNPGSVLSYCMAVPAHCDFSFRGSSTFL